MDILDLKLAFIDKYFSTKEVELEAAITKNYHQESGGVSWMGMSQEGDFVCIFQGPTVL